MRTMALLILCFAGALTAAAEDPTTDPSLRYLVLATNRTSTMQNELDMAAREGFRAIAGLPKDDEFVLLLEKMAQPAAPYSYRLLATHRTSTMEKELNEAGRDGFRLLPQTTLEKGDEVVVLMEREANTEQRYEYRLLATHRLSTLQRELDEAGKAGFVLKATFSRDETMAVMERPVKPAGKPK